MITKKELCSGCNACSSVCPKKCIEMQSDNEGFRYPVINIDACIKCGLCEKICPVIEKGPVNTVANTVCAAVNKNTSDRNNSSSGGVFSLLAKRILEQNGVVVGAAFKENFKEVVHIIIDKKEDLYKLQGSKYVQSSINNTYVDTKHLLDEGKRVLFTGTPCQIGGLHAFLGKSYENLYTQDIICHGVPSPLVWEKYVDFLETKNNSKAKDAFFRNKDFGWKRFSIKVQFSNGATYINEHTKDLFMRGFLRNLYLRPSCHSCSFKSLERTSDITLADFWGIDKICPEFDDNKGVSLVLVNSKKGQELFDDISTNLEIKETQINAAIEHNTAAISSVKPHCNRKRFFRIINKYDVEKAIDKCLHINYFLRVKNGIARRVKKVLHIGRRG